MMCSFFIIFITKIIDSRSLSLYNGNLGYENMITFRC